jgi:hypothetical protein
VTQAPVRRATEFERSQRVISGRCNEEEDHR